MPPDLPLDEIRFGPFVLDPEAPELRRNGAPVEIRATPLRLLVSLATRLGDVVPKQTLMDEVWPGVAVGDASLSTALRELRLALGDDGRQQRFIRTLRHRGFRLEPVASTDALPEVSASASSDADAAAEEDRRFALFTRLGAALFAAGQHEEARAAYGEAARVARGEGDDAKFVQAALEFAGKITNTETAAPSKERMELLEEATARDAHEPASTRARLRARLALDLAWTRRPEALALIDEATRLARGVDAATQAQVLHDTFWVRWSPDNLEERLALARELIARAESAGDGLIAGIGRLLEGTALLETGQRAEADAATRRAFDQVKPHGPVGLPQWRDSWQASAALLDGRFDEAERFANRAFRHGLSLRTHNAQRVQAMHLGWLRFDQGRGAELAPLAAALDDGLPVMRTGAVLVRYASNQPDAARAGLLALTEELDALPRDSFWLPTLAGLAEVAAGLDEGECAERLYPALLPHEGQCVVIGVRGVCRGSVALYLGLLARLLGQEDAAHRHFERAVRVHAQLRALPLLARSQLELARSLVRPGNEAEVGRALAALAEVEALDLGLGVEHRQAEIAEIRRSLRA